LNIELLENKCSQAFYSKVSAPLPMSPTMHHYFNLSGDPQVNSHKLTLNCVKDVNSHHVEIDFRKPRSLGELLENGGVDENFTLENSSAVQILPWAAELAVVDLNLKISTNLPCVQVYTFNDPNASYLGKEGWVYEKHSGVCLETQFAPGAVQNSALNSPLLLENETGVYVTQYEFFSLVGNSVLSKGTSS
jgi:aldose 1-epimerase